MKVAVVDLHPREGGFPAWARERLAERGVEVVERSVPKDVSASAAADGRLDGDALAEAAAGCELLMSTGTVFGGEVLARLPELRWVVRMGSGFENVPVEACTAAGVVVANTPRANVSPVSEHAVALLLAAARQIPVIDRAMHDGSWAARGEWNAGVGGHTAVSLAGGVLGLIGFGAISQSVAHKLSVFDLAEIVAADPAVSAEEMAAVGVRKVELPELLAASDFVSVHVPHIEATTHLLGEQEFAQMKPSCILVNTARGPVIDEAAMISALRTGVIAAAAVDGARSRTLSCAAKPP